MSRKADKQRQIRLTEKNWQWLKVRAGLAFPKASVTAMANAALEWYRANVPTETNKP
jgi:hypothetical protein